VGAADTDGVRVYPWQKYYTQNGETEKCLYESPGRSKVRLIRWRQNAIKYNGESYDSSGGALRFKPIGCVRQGV